MCTADRFQVCVLRRRLTACLVTVSELPRLDQASCARTLGGPKNFGQMAHKHPHHPHFTVEVCRRGLLHEPFRLIDVGVRGGVGEHWLFFGDHLELWGFDPLLDQGVGPLIAANPHPERLHYLNVALGDKDETRHFKFYPENPSSSHFAASNGADDAAVDDTWQQVAVRTLDSLCQQGTIGSIDFMKMDAESYEVEIVKGAAQFFRTSGIFGVESESTFMRTPRSPRSHFVELFEQLTQYGFNVYDTGIQRAPRSAMNRGFPEYERNGKYRLRPTGKAFVFDFLFLNDVFDNVAAQRNLSVDRLIKMIAAAETYGLQDVGLDILFSNKEALGRRLDVAEAANWLVREHPNSTLTYEEYRSLPADSNNPASPDVCHAGRIAEQDALLSQKEAALQAMRSSRSWRMTAPLRQFTLWLRR
jgi:FkbM family methyltransferase